MTAIAVELRNVAGTDAGWLGLGAGHAMSVANSARRGFPVDVRSR